MLIDRIEKAFATSAVWFGVVMFYVLWLLTVIGIFVALFHFAKNYLGWNI